MKKLSTFLIVACIGLFVVSVPIFGPGPWFAHKCMSDPCTHPQHWKKPKPPNKRGGGGPGYEQSPIGQYWWSTFTRPPGGKEGEG